LILQGMLATPHNRQIYSTLIKQEGGYRKTY